MWDLSCQTKDLEKSAEEGDSPVVEDNESPRGIPSTMGHVKSHGNQRRPLCKAKYYLVTDSEQVQ